MHFNQECLLHMVTGQIGPRLDHGCGNLETVHDLDECSGQRKVWNKSLPEIDSRKRGRTEWSKQIFGDMFLG